MNRRISIFWIVALCWGCQSEAPVELSGGVQHPGAYAYRPEWDAEDYIQAAGGYTDEAIAVDAYLVRGVVDSIDENQIWQLHQPLADGPEVLPGDAIQVPVRTYSVHLDTVRLVRDLRLVYERVLLKMARGALVAGWTERGAMVGILIGRGQAYDLPDTARAASGFHYLYIHLHPDQYAQIRAFASDAVDSLEAIEDAIEIHKTAFPRCEYQTEGAAVLPPDGYFRVLRGVWYTPRSAANPGRGMRKRFYEDGRIWTTFPDGRQRWQYPDGRVVMAFANGQKEERFPDGRVALTNLQGHVRTTYPDGGETWEMATRPDEAQAAPKDVQIEVPRDDWIFRPPGPHEIRPAHLHGHRVLSDGRVAWQHRDGSMAEVRPDGYRRYRLPSGDAYEVFPDSRTVEISRFGHRFETFPDGRRTLAMPQAYAYPGRVQADLAEVSQMPDHLPVGGELVVEGLLSEGVQDVAVSAFLAPDGDVIMARLVRRGRAFRGRFRFKEMGHYRVQVQVTLPGLRTTTAVHHAVAVGEAGALNPEVLPIETYPGDEAAAQMLIDQINASRKALRRRTVMPHPELMVVARIRLEEMLEKGEVSHVSKTGATASWHIRHRGIRVKRVGENVASGRFLEGLHAHWMLSAGHRRNILSRHWTHVGTAATRWGDGVWAVQIFGEF